MSTHTSMYMSMHIFVHMSMHRADLFVPAGGVMLEMRGGCWAVAAVVDQTEWARGTASG